MVPHVNRRKLDEKAIECIYLRKVEDHKAFRLINKDKQKVIINRDVVFFEEEMVKSKNEENINSFCI